MATGHDEAVNREYFIEDAISAAASILGFSQLREHQFSGAMSIISGKDTFVAKPTGSGKSLIYYLVPLATDYIDSKMSDASVTKDDRNFAVVLSPLVSLIKDQMRQLKEKNITALCLEQDSQLTARLKKNDYSFVYCSPEAVLRDYRVIFKSKVFQEKLCCIVIDESHCIVKW